MPMHTYYEYPISGRPVTVTRRSPYTNQLNTRVLDCDIAQIRAWEAGELIQNALPQLTPDEREFLLSGLTPEDWQDMIGKEEQHNNQQDT